MPQVFRPATGRAQDRRRMAISSRASAKVLRTVITGAISISNTTRTCLGCMYTPPHLSLSTVAYGSSYQVHHLGFHHRSSSHRWHHQLLSSSSRSPVSRRENKACSRRLLPPAFTPTITLWTLPTCDTATGTYGAAPHALLRPI